MRNKNYLIKPILGITLLLYSHLLFAQNKMEIHASESATNTKFLNPILAGDFPDPTIMRDGKDYYMTHSSMFYVPGLVVLHSSDLVNWEPISNALNAYLGSVWAPDIFKYNDKYYIYFTVAGKGNFAVYSTSPYGPWSEPVNLQIDGIDPGHIVDHKGNRWVFMNGGYRAKLNPNGLGVVPGTLEKVYDGWDFPIEWESDGFNLEGPKLKKIKDYYYKVSAQGGTAGPPTSHMAILARSKSLDGPWENSPYNPLIRTLKNSEKWWAKGHGSLIDTPDGKWWIVYHAYENGFLGRGRQTLLEPLKMTDDGWLIAPLGEEVEKPILKPITSSTAINRLDHINKFRIGLDWKFFEEYSSDRVNFKNGVLNIRAKGNSPRDSAPLLFVPTSNNYEISAKIEIDSGTVGGLTLFYNKDFYVGTGFDVEKRIRWRKGDVRGTWNHHESCRELWLRIRNIDHIITGYYSYDGIIWKKERWGMDISGYHHNTLYGFISVLPGLFAYGEGEVRFSNFDFKILE